MPNLTDQTAFVLVNASEWPVLKTVSFRAAGGMPPPAGFWPRGWAAFPVTFVQAKPRRRACLGKVEHLTFGERLEFKSPLCESSGPAAQQPLAVFVSQGPTPVSRSSYLMLPLI